MLHLHSLRAAAENICLTEMFKAYHVVQTVRLKKTQSLSCKRKKILVTMLEEMTRWPVLGSGNVYLSHLRARVTQVHVESSRLDPTGPCAFFNESHPELMIFYIIYRLTCGKIECKSWIKDVRDIVLKVFSFVFKYIW